jgi:septal ring factor EnvC (AmiA/AmiB activator)
MLAALRGEVAAAERRLQEERDAHAGARRTFVAREAELEANLSESGAALAAMQRTLGDRGARCAAAEERAAGLQQERDQLAAQLAALQAQRAGRCGAQ